MPIQSLRPGDYLTYILVGILFIVLGVLSIVWGYHEENKYYMAISKRYDVREFLTRWPPHPQPWALKLGGIIAIAVGVSLLGFGVYNWLRPGAI